MLSVLKQRFGGIGLNAPDISPAVWKREIPFTMAAISCRADIVKAFFEKPAAEAVALAQKAFPDLTDAMCAPFVNHWKNGFKLQGPLAEILPAQVNKMNKARANAAETIDTIVVLVKNGGDPISIMLDSNLAVPELKAYLDAGLPADINVKGYSTVHAAYPGSSEYFIDKLTALLARGANPSTVSLHNGAKIGTFLHVIIANEDQKNFDGSIGLVKDRFDPSLVDGEKKTILVTAAKIMNEDMVIDIATTFGTRAMLNLPDADGRTALHYCYAYGMQDAARVLKRLGAREDIPDLKGLLPKDYLDQLNQKDVERMLLSIEIHPGRDYNATRNALSDWNQIPIHKNGQAQLMTVENLAGFAVELVQDLNVRGPASILYKHAQERFMGDRSSRFICASRGEPVHTSVMRECAMTFKKWQTESTQLVGVSLIDGIADLRQQMRRQPDLYIASGKPVVEWKPGSP